MKADKEIPFSPQDLPKHTGVLDEQDRKRAIKAWEDVITRHPDSARKVNPIEDPPPSHTGVLDEQDRIRAQKAWGEFITRNRKH